MKKNMNQDKNIRPKTALSVWNRLPVSITRHALFHCYRYAPKRGRVRRPSGYPQDRSKKSSRAVFSFPPTKKSTGAKDWLGRLMCIVTHASSVLGILLISKRVRLMLIGSHVNISSSTELLELRSKILKWVR